MKKAAVFITLFFLSQFLYAQWYYTSVQVSTNSIAFVNNTTGFCSTGFAIFKTTDGGTTWTAVAGFAMDSIITCLSFPAETIGYATGLSGNLLKTTDGGATWNPLNCGTTKDLRQVFFTDVNTGYIAGDEHSMFKTTDGGVTWQTLNSPVETTFSLFFISNTKGFLAGNTSTLYRTEDGGLTWTGTQLSNSNDYMGVYFADPLTGYAAGQENALVPCMAKTTDGGLTWTEIPVTVGSGLNTVFFLNDNVGYAGGYSGTIIKTTDGGLTWGKQTTPNLGPIYALCFIDSEHGFAGGAGLLKTDNGGGSLGILETATSEPAWIYPNPAIDLVTISTGKDPENGSLTVFNSKGQKMAYKTITTFPSRLDVSGWPSGNYLIRIDAGHHVYTGKFMKQNP